MVPVAEKRFGHPSDCPLFRGISQEGLEELGHIAAPVKLEPQERLLTDPEHSREIWMIKEGLVSLIYGDAEGRDATVMLLDAGDLFGAIGWQERLDYSQNVVALKPTVLWRMMQQQMENLFNKYPVLGYRITQFSWRRIARLEQRLAELMTKSVRVRLASLLLNLAADYGEDKAEGIRSLGLTVTHDDLSRLVGSSREMVSKIVGQFRDAGWINSSRKRIELTNRKVLQEIAGGH